MQKKESNQLTESFKKYHVIFPKILRVVLGWDDQESKKKSSAFYNKLKRTSGHGII